jgi:hypothetical protein
MSQESSPPDGLAHAYLALRKAIGIIGLALPFVLALGKRLLQCGGLEPSISHYYYTDMRNVLVGSLFAVGVFLMSYPGYDKADRIAGNLAGVFAIGVALVRTTCEVCPPSEHDPIGKVHLTLAALLFLTLAYFSLCLFTKTDPNEEPTRQKLQRNTIYRVCGWMIVACVLAIGVLKLFLPTSLECHSTVFWLESVAIIAFGASWLIKGETILKDQ